MATKSDDPPFITPRSPSNERAQREHAHPSPPGDEVLVALLARLVELEHDASRAVVAGGADPTEYSLRARAVGELIDSLGGSPPRFEESRELLAHGASAVEHSADVTATLREMQAELVAAYAEAASDPRLSEGQRDALRRLAP